MADQFSCVTSRENAVFVIESAFFFAPRPMKEKSKSCQWTLSSATALFETGSGSASVSGCDWDGGDCAGDCANERLVKKTKTNTKKSFFMFSQSTIG